MQRIFIKTTIPELPEAVRVSINSCIQVKATPEKHVKYVRKLAKIRGLSATYELATEEQYWAHRKQVQAFIAAAKQAA